jgi:hypothetical protein
MALQSRLWPSRRPRPGTPRSSSAICLSLNPYSRAAPIASRRFRSASHRSLMMSVSDLGTSVMVPEAIRWSSGRAA